MNNQPASALRARTSVLERAVWAALPIVTLLSLVLAAGPADAQTSSTTPSPFTSGMLSGLTGSTLSVQARNGRATTVVVTSSTTYQQTKTATASDIAQGDCVRIVGTGSTTSGIQATTVVLTKPTSKGCTPRNPLGGNGSGSGARRFGNGTPGSTPFTLPNGSAGTVPANIAAAFGTVSSVSGDQLTVKAQAPKTTKKTKKTKVKDWDGGGHAHRVNHGHRDGQRGRRRSRRRFVRDRQRDRRQPRNDHRQERHHLPTPERLLRWRLRRFRRQGRVRRRCGGGNTDLQQLRRSRPWLQLKPTRTQQRAGTSQNRGRRRVRPLGRDAAGRSFTIDVAGRAMTSRAGQEPWARLVCLRSSPDCAAGRSSDPIIQGSRCSPTGPGRKAGSARSRRHRRGSPTVDSIREGPARRVHGASCRRLPLSDGRARSVGPCSHSRSRRPRRRGSAPCRPWDRDGGGAEARPHRRAGGSARGDRERADRASPWTTGRSSRSRPTNSATFWPGANSLSTADRPSHGARRIGAATDPDRGGAPCRESMPKRSA